MDNVSESARGVHFDKDLTESYSTPDCFPVYECFIDRTSAGKENAQDFQMCFHDSAKLIQLNYLPLRQGTSPVPILLSGLILDEEFYLSDTVSCLRELKL